MVVEGKFREDLYYRLNNITITTPTLRERPEDIEPLVAYFTELVCKENNFTKHFQKRCLEIFRQYHWQGNVRELRAVVESHLIRSDKNIINPEDLSANLFEKSNSGPITLEQIDEHVEHIKKNLVVDIMKSAKSKAEASRKLGIPQNRLSYFIEKWGLDKNI